MQRREVAWIADPQGGDESPKVDWVEGMRTGGWPAWEAILVLYGAKVKAYLKRKYGLQDADLEEILAEALLRLWEKRGAYDPERGTLRAWFFHLARRAAVNRWRKRGVMATPCGAGDHFSYPQHEECPESAEVRDLDEILAGLVPENLQILLAGSAADEELGWAKDLGAELGMKSGTIRKRYFDLRKKVQKEMVRRGHLMPDGPSSDKGESR